MVGCALCYALLGLMKTHRTPVLLYAMVAAQGLLGYGMAAVFGAVPAELFAGRHYGAITGMLSVAARLGAGLGPWVTGFLYDRTGNYVVAFRLGMWMRLAAILCIWVGAPREGRGGAGEGGRVQH